MSPGLNIGVMDLIRVKSQGERRGSGSGFGVGFASGLGLGLKLISGLGKLIESETHSLRCLCIMGDKIGVQH